MHLLYHISTHCEASKVHNMLGSVKENSWKAPKMTKQANIVIIINVS
jgi:hypothetical protein